MRMTSPSVFGVSPWNEQKPADWRASSFGGLAPSLLPKRITPDDDGDDEGAHDSHHGMRTHLPSTRAMHPPL